MERISVAPGETVQAAGAGQQRFVGGGARSCVRLNGDPNDYMLASTPEAANDRDLYVLTAHNGSGTYIFESAIERISFVSGAYTLLRNLPAVIAAGDRHAIRRATTERFTSYAQIREDVLLMRALRDVPPEAGFYVDVGAYDPDVDSVTRLFYERGWRGINIEPSPLHHARFVARRPRDRNLCAAASAAPGLMRFFHNDGEQLGTLEQRFADPAAAALDVPVVRIADVCREAGAADIHFLKIDVEGHERQVLDGCDFATLRPWIVVIEAVAPNRADIATFGEWEDVLLDAGYALAAEDELNRYYLARERLALMKYFALPVDNHVAASVLAECDRLTALVTELRATTAGLERQLAQRRRAGPLKRLQQKLSR